MTPVTLLAGSLQQILDRYLRLDPDAPAKAAALSGRTIAVEVLLASNVGFILYFQPDADGIRVTDCVSEIPDVIIRGTPLALANQARRGASFDSGVSIEGDVDIGRAFQDLLLGVEIDWEEQLARVVGDLPARQAGNTLRGLQAWGRQAVNTLFQDVAEYLQEEARDLPSSAAVAEFLDGVDRLRSDCDRLEARIRRLQRAEHT